MYRPFIIRPVRSRSFCSFPWASLFFSFIFFPLASLFSAFQHASFFSLTAFLYPLSFTITEYPTLGALRITSLHKRWQCNHLHFLPASEAGSFTEYELLPSSYSRRDWWLSNGKRSDFLWNSWLLTKISPSLQVGEKSDSRNRLGDLGGAHWDASGRGGVCELLVNEKQGQENGECSVHGKAFQGENGSHFNRRSN